MLGRPSVNFDWPDYLSPENGSVAADGLTHCDATRSCYSTDTVTKTGRFFCVSKSVGYGLQSLCLHRNCFSSLSPGQIIRLMQTQDKAGTAVTFPVNISKPLFKCVQRPPPGKHTNISQHLLEGWMDLWKGTMVPSPHIKLASHHHELYVPFTEEVADLNGGERELKKEACESHQKKRIPYLLSKLTRGSILVLWYHCLISHTQHEDIPKLHINTH